MGCAAGVIGSTGYYWVVSNSGTMYQCGFNSGSVYNSFSIPGSYPYGVTFRDSGSIYYVYYTDRSARRLYRMNSTTGSIYGSYTLSFPPNDLAYDDRGFLWIADSTASVIRRCSMSGSVYDSFSVASYGYPAGVGFDGTYVWVGINAPLHRILRFEVEGVGIEPASLGKIKTVFR
jgi:streptogramin lyase